MTPATDQPDPQATILITTRDRRARLREALRSALDQTARVEVIVLDDASRDGTSDMVSGEFPGVRLVRSQTPIGCPAQRNRGFALARGQVVVCLDDDAWFSSARTVQQVLQEFDDPRIGVVTIPYLNVRREEWLRQQAPDGRPWAAGTFAGGSCALRRGTFLQAGGYAVDFVKHGEETDLAVRLLDRGHVVRLGCADHIVHDEAQVHKPAQDHRLSARNHLLGAWRNVPRPFLTTRLTVVAANTIRVGVQGRQGRAAALGVAAATLVMASGRAPRAPVARPTYVLFRRLIRRGPLPLAQVLAQLPAAASTAERPLHVVSVLTTHASGGAEYAAVDLLDALARRGARVRLLTNRVDLVAGTSVAAVPIDLGPKLRRRTLTGVALKAPLTLARLLAALRREAQTAPIDVLLVHHKKEQLLSVAVPRSLARAVVWAEWGPLPARLRGGSPRRVYALASRVAHALIAESDATARSVIDAGVAAKKVVVVPNVLDAGLLAFDPVARADLRRSWGWQDAFVLGCISRLDPAKRVDVVIDALGYLDEQVVLVVAGEGEHEEQLRARAARFGARVMFIASARGQAAEILSACDVQVYAPGPSEGAARAVTFGQLVARPVIATAPEGAKGLVVAGTGTIVSPPHDARALAHVVAGYRADPQRVASEGAAGRDLALKRIEDADAVATLERTLRQVSRPE